MLNYFEKRGCKSDKSSFLGLLRIFHSSIQGKQSMFPRGGTPFLRTTGSDWRSTLGEVLVPALARLSCQPISRGKLLLARFYESLTSHKSPLKKNILLSFVGDRHIETLSNEHMLSTRFQWSNQRQISASYSWWQAARIVTCW